MFTKNKLINVFILVAVLCPFGVTLASDIDSPDKQEIAQDGTVRGIVKDADGAVAGASVTVVGTTAGTVTDNEGRYTLRNVRKGAKIKVAFIGYETKEAVYNGQTTLDFQITEDENLLDEVVVTALGIPKEAKALGFAATTISAKELTKVGTPNFGTALYGKAPGVQIQTTQGGSIAAVSITVRGINSITGSNQPLVVMNGVPIRNGGTGSGNEATFAEFGAEGRIRSNGLVDINPEDIESLTILKGAAATALYGSEAANGVIMITSKKAKSGTLTIDFNAHLTVNEVYSVPPLQTEYGPGTYVRSYTDYEKTTGGFYERTLDGITYKSLRYGNTAWGPKYDGSEVLYWDGKMRPYVPYSAEPWKAVFQTGYNQNYSFAVNKGGDQHRTRLTYTFNRETPNFPGGDYQKHNFQMIGSLNLSSTISLDYSANYVMQLIHNRAQNSMGMWGSFSNGFSSFTDVELVRKMYVTSLGYRNVNRNGDPTLTPDEAFAFSASDTNGLRGVFWDIYQNNSDEAENRLIAHVTPKWKILSWLSLKTQLSTDVTFGKSEVKRRTERPLSLGYDPSGGFNQVTKRYDIRYGDVMLTADKKLTDKLNLTVNMGWQGQYHVSLNTNSYVDGGLATENWFNLNASRYQPRTSVGTSEYLKTAYVGTVDLGWSNFLYLTVTGRQEKSSTLKKGSNTYFYPSYSGSFVFSDAFRESLPTWYDYGKFRVSYGIVGNAPGVYSANIVYDQVSTNDFTYNYVPSSLGNEKIRPEKKTEIEIGLESKFFKDRLGFEITYYNGTMSDQILAAPQPPTSGVSSILLNVGEMQNYGVELSLYGSPVKTRNFTWTPILNVSRNYNRINSLVEGVEYLMNSGWGGDGMQLRSYVGRPMGDFYTYVPMKDPNGNNIVNSDGLYVNDPERQSVGNSQEQFIGGFINQFVYRNLFMDITTDFVIGGNVLNEMYQYATAQGHTPATLKGRSAETGGLAYYFPADNNRSALPLPAPAGATSGPNGEIIYYNGTIQEGVVEIKDADGNVTGYQPNTQILPIDYLTYQTYGWGTSTTQKTYMHSMFSKTYWKVRELAFGYQIPKKIAAKLYCKNLSVSFFARNLFYFYKEMPDWDVESSIGTNWTNRAYIGGSTAPNRSYGFSLRASF
jgi:TonB-linked SusC/RagA family outer membrane protein